MVKLPREVSLPGLVKKLGMVMRRNYEDDKEVACEKILIVMVIGPGTSLLMLVVACYDVIIIKPAGCQGGGGDDHGDEHLQEDEKIYI